MPTFIHARCPCGRSLRARPDQMGTAIHCWSCGGEVVVPYLDLRGQLVRPLMDSATDLFRSQTPTMIFGGVLLITAVLLVPRVGLLLALGLVAASARGYGRQVRAGAVAPPPGAVASGAPGLASDSD